MTLMRNASIGLSLALAVSAGGLRATEEFSAMLAEATRLSQEASWRDVRELLPRLDATIDQATERERTSYELLRVRNAALAGEFDVAIRRVKALVGRIDTLEPDLALRTLNLATNVLVVNDQFKDGFGYFRQALDRAPLVDNLQMRADTYSVAAEFYDRIGETSTALAYADRALQLAENGGYERQQCIALERGARALMHQQAWSPAEERFDRATQHCERAAESVFSGMAYLGLGRVYRNTGRLQAAEREIRRSLALFDRVEFHEGALEARTELAWLKIEDGDLQTAERALAPIDAMLRQLGDLGVRAEAFRVRAELAQLQGDESGALEWFRTAMVHRSEKSERQRAMRIALLINEHDTAAREKELALLREQNRALLLSREERKQSGLGVLYGSSGIVVATVLIAVLLMQTARDRKRYRSLSERDGLTGLLNHTRFFELANPAFQRSVQLGRPFTLVVADIDLFKQINDRHGHLVGDSILRRAGASLREAFGPEAILGRLGGEEFGVALPQEDTDAAVARIEHLRAIINHRPDDVEDPQITLSFGVAERGREKNLDLLYARADQALYDAKDAGRNRVVTVARLNLEPARFVT